MASFADGAKRSWTLAVDIGTVRRIKAELSVDLLALPWNELLDPAQVVRLCDVVYQMVKPQADKLGLTADQFFDSLTPDAIDGAGKALLEALADFTPSQRRPLARKAVESLLALKDRADRLSAVQAKAGLAEAEEKLAAEEARSSGSSSGNLPGQSA